MGTQCERRLRGEIGLGLGLGMGLALSLALGCAAPGAEAGAGTDEVEPDPDDPCAPGPAPTLALGQGELAFAPVTDGDILDLVHGPQGGVHTLIALDARDIDGSVELVGELRGYLDGELRAQSYPYLNFRCSEDEGLQVWGLFLIWDAEPEELHLQDVRIEAEFSDASGLTLMTSEDVTLHDPELD